MILVDTSVWIDYFKALPTQESESLAEALAVPGGVLVGDVVLLELLQGMPSPRAARIMESTLSKLPKVTLLDFSIARQAARHYRTLRALGITPRRTTDLIIGTWCIAHDCELLHRDRDFIPMQHHLGLRARTAPAH
jgi:predicted nucleic acid-binding protein